VTDKASPSLPASRGRNREVWVGLFVILGIASALLALFSLTDAALFRGRYVVLTVVPDAGGIRRGDPVQMRGVNIGRVTRFQIGDQGVLVDLEIDGIFPIPSDSHVELRSSGLIGGMVASVIPGKAQTTVGWNDTLSGVIQQGVFDQAGDLQVEATRALDRVQRLLNDETLGNVHEGGQDLRKLLRELASTAGQQRGELEALSQSLRRSVQAVEATVTGPRVEGSLRQMESLVGRLDSLADVLGRSAASADNILSRIDRGEGTLGRMTTDEQLYENMSAAALSVQQAADAFARLATDIREQPKKYFDVKVF
jgi:phospholipid/cholesterol/gamma-HCH transport system substrate-binding protein